MVAGGVSCGTLGLGPPTYVSNVLYNKGPVYSFVRSTPYRLVTDTRAPCREDN